MHLATIPSDLHHQYLINELTTSPGSWAEVGLRPTSPQAFFISMLHANIDKLGEGLGMGDEANLDCLGSYHRVSLAWAGPPDYHRVSRFGGLLNSGVERWNGGTESND